MLSAEEQNRLVRGLRKIKVTWIVSVVAGSVVIAYTYAVMMLYVPYDPTIIESVQKAFTDHGLEPQALPTLTAAFCICSFVALGLLYLLRRFILTFQADASGFSYPEYVLLRVLSRYNLVVMGSSLMVFLIPALGIPLLMFAGGAHAVALAILVPWGVGLVLTMPRNAELNETMAQWTAQADLRSSRESAGSAEPCFVMRCSAMDLGYVRMPGGRLVVRPHELLIRPFLGLLGEYRLQADQVLAFHVESKNWLTGLRIRIEHGVPDVPGRIVLGFEAEPQEFSSCMALVGFKPLASRSTVRPTSGLPVRVSALVSLVILWNALILLGIWFDRSFLVAAMLMLLAGSLLIPKWPFLERLVMKPGRDSREIGPFLALIRLISLILLIGPLVGLLTRML